MKGLKGDPKDYSLVVSHCAAPCWWRSQDKIQRRSMGLAQPLVLQHLGTDHGKETLLAAGRATLLPAVSPAGSLAAAAGWAGEQQQLRRGPGAERPGS